MKDYIVKKLKSLADNEYMDKYIEICSFYKDKAYTKDRKYEFHHCFTSFMYKNEIGAKNRDNTIDKLDEDYKPEDNIIKMPCKWHLISHWYLAKALQTKEAINAFQIFIEDYNRSPFDYSREEIEGIAKDYQETSSDNSFDEYINRKDKEQVYKKQQKDFVKEKQKEEQEKRNQVRKNKINKALRRK